MDFFSFQEKMKQPPPDAAKKAPRQILTVSQLTAQIDRCFKKTFTYTMRPRHTGIREVPPIEIAYFDPDTRQFQVVRSAPVPLRVDAASSLAITEVVDATGESTKNVLGQ